MSLSNSEKNVGEVEKRSHARKLLILALIALIPATGLLLYFITSMIQFKRMRQHVENIRRIGQAMQDYDEAHGRLPAVATFSEDGKPLLSWRVLILPFIGQEQLYSEFHLDEPWDSPHNIELLPRMPAIYGPPPGTFSNMPKYHTAIHVFVGKQAAFEGTEGLRLRGDFPDGDSNTILFVEAGDPVPWTMPQEIAFDPDGPLPSCLLGDRFIVGMADGTVRWIPNDIKERVLRAAITRNGDEVFPGQW
jgi:hypothetical protein